MIENHNSKTGRAIWWIRRDLRLADNQALSAALAYAQNVLPLFVLDSRLVKSQYSGTKRMAFLFTGLRSLDDDLQAIGSGLIVREGDPAQVLPQLLAESGATAVFAEDDVSPFARRRDAEVAKAVPLFLTGGLTVHPPDMVIKPDGKPYTVFTPFSKTWKTMSLPEKADLLPAPESLGSLPALPFASIPDGFGETELVISAGEKEALRRLKVFADGPIYSYGQERNRPDLDATSGLSPYLRFGMVSMRRAVVQAIEAIELAAAGNGRKGAETWLNELIWREFFISILYHFPHVRERSFRPEYDNIRWDKDEAAFEAWCRGLTGYPLVDAAMRQLLHSGWMHNRTRMVTASFLVKDLLIDWRWGERWFMQHLIDGDPAANNGGWQWTAGTGTDAAPYFRIFNPILQSKKFDPQGEYVRRWVPELEAVPDSYIHEPWRMPQNVQKASRCVLGHDYPEPIVDHRAARDRTLAAYERAREENESA